MLKRFAINIWFYLGLVSCAVLFSSCNDEDDFDIFLLIGQSNCAGRGDV